MFHSLGVIYVKHLSPCLVEILPGWRSVIAPLYWTSRTVTNWLRYDEAVFFKILKI